MARPIIRFVSATLGLTAIALAFSTPAAAQGFFSGFFDRPAASAYAPSRSPERSGSLFGDFFGSPQVEAPRPRGGGQAYCVRLCDGRYFPLAKAMHASVSPAKVCAALCPAAKTQVFTGSEPTQSAAADGTRYASLKNALLYREKTVPGCSCTGEGPGGLASIDIDSDPTLRAGDVVVKEDGAAVFNGSTDFPHRPADFAGLNGRSVAALDAKRLLANLRVDETPRRSMPLQSLAPSAKDKEEASRKRRAYRPAQPRAVAEQSFFGIRFR